MRADSWQHKFAAAALHIQRNSFEGSQALQMLALKSRAQLKNLLLVYQVNCCMHSAAYAGNKSATLKLITWTQPTVVKALAIVYWRFWPVLPAARLDAVSE